MSLPRKPHHKRLQRKTGLARGPGPKRTGKVNPVSDRRRERDAVYPQRKAERAAMDGWRCVLKVPGVCTGGYEQTHHWAGRVGKDPHRLANLRSCCAACHRYVTEHPAEAIANGWSGSRHNPT